MSKVRDRMKTCENVAYTKIERLVKVAKDPTQSARNRTQAVCRLTNIWRRAALAIKEIGPMETVQLIAEMEDRGFVAQTIPENVGTHRRKAAELLAGESVPDSGDLEIHSDE